jgi:DNA-directed RNA polymerase specialized sigma24 family protein
MSEEMLLIYILAGCLLLMAIFLIVREYGAAKQLRKIVAALRAAQRARITLEHDLKIAQQTALDQIKSQSAAILSEHIRAMQEELRDMQFENDAKALRIGRLEERIDEFFAAPSQLGIDASKVIALYNSGFNSKEIAKELKVNQNEVVLTLRLNNLEPR